MSAPDIGPKEIEAVGRALRSGVVSQGVFQELFEREFSGFLKVRHAVAVSSGTAALHLCLTAAGVKAGDAVFTSPFSFVASANTILYLGARPIFVDVEPESGNLDPARLAESLGVEASRGDPSRLRAVLPIHVFGTPADMPALLGIAGGHGLAVIEDACEAVGAECGGAKAGAMGDFAAFGFYPNKQITTGEGGMAVTNSDAGAELLRSLRNQGRDGSAEHLRHVRLGYNYRLDEMSCALGYVQTQRIAELLRKRRRVASWYDAGLEDARHLEKPSAAPSNRVRSWFAYVVRIKPPFRRDAVRRRLQAAGIPSRPYFQPLHLQPFYREAFGYRRGDFPVAEKLGDQSLALPFSAVMTKAQVEFVCGALRGALSGGRRSRRD